MEGIRWIFRKIVVRRSLRSHTRLIQQHEQVTRVTSSSRRMYRVTFCWQRNDSLKRRSSLCTIIFRRWAELKSPTIWSISRSSKWPSDWPRVISSSNECFIYLTEMVMVKSHLLSFSRVFLYCVIKLRGQTNFFVRSFSLYLSLCTSHTHANKYSFI